MLSHESSYCLDSMTELLYLTPDMNHMMHYHRPDIDGLFDDIEENKGKYLEEGDDDNPWLTIIMEREIIRLFYKMRDELSPEMKAFHTFAGIDGLGSQFNEFVGTISHDIFNDYKRNVLDIRPGNHERIFSETQTNIVTKEEDLYDQKIIDHYINNTRNCFPKWFNLLKDFDERVQYDFMNFDAIRFLEIMEEEQIRLNVEEQRMREQIASIRGECQWVDLTPETVDYYNNTTREIKKIKTYSRQNKKRARKAIRRGYETFCRLFGKNHIDGFLKGEDYVIEGTYFNYIARKRSDNVYKHTLAPQSCHVPYNLIIESKDKVIMGEGCVYFDNTPIIDQLIALTMFAKGDEKTLLAKTNWFNCNVNFMSLPIMQEIKKIKKEMQKNERAQRRNYDENNENVSYIKNISGNDTRALSRRITGYTDEELDFEEELEEREMDYKYYMIGHIVKHIPLPISHTQWLLNPGFRLDLLKESEPNEIMEMINASPQMRLLTNAVL